MSPQTLNFMKLYVYGLPEDCSVAYGMFFFFQKPEHNICLMMCNYMCLLSMQDFGSEVMRLFPLSRLGVFFETLTPVLTDF